MRTIDLQERAVTVEELLDLASSDGVFIRSQAGREFILEPADEFDREVAMLGRSEKFMRFLADRSKEAGTVSIEQLRRDLEKECEEGDVP